MIFRIMILLLACAGQTFAKPPSEIVASGTIGNGGNVDLDELNGFKALVIEGMRSERTLFEGLLKELGELRTLDEVLADMEQVKLYPDHMVTQMTKPDGDPLPYDHVFQVSPDKIFFIDGEKRVGINVHNDEFALAVFDMKDFAKLDGRYNAKVVQVGHEVLGAVGLEKTKENHISRHFGHFADDYLKVDIDVKGNAEKIPVVPLWNRRYVADFNLGSAELAGCSSEVARAAYREAITLLCKEQIPKTRPSPYFMYECAFEGKINQHVDLEWKTTDIQTSALVPAIEGNIHTQSDYYRRDRFSAVYRHNESTADFYRPGYLEQTHTHIAEPVNLTTCKLAGRIFLTGIDPITKDFSVKRLRTSDSAEKETWWKTVSLTEPNPEKATKKRCTTWRAKTVRQDFFNDSYCLTKQNDDKTWTWEVWGVHPYRSAYE